MRKQILLILFLIFTISVYSQSPKVEARLNRLYDTVLSESEGYIGVVKDGKLGFVDINGDVYISPRFDFNRDLLDINSFIYFQPYIFKNGSTIIYEDNEYRLINKLGVFVFGDSVRIHGRSNDGIIIEKENIYNIYNSEGIRKTNSDYQLIKDILVSNLFLSKKDNKYGLLNNEGKSIYPNLFDTLKVYKNLNSQYYIKGRLGNKTALLNTDGKVVFQPYYNDVFVLHGDYVLSYDSNKYGLATTNGKGILYPEFDTIISLIEYDTLFQAVIGNKNMIFNSNSQLIKYFDQDTVIYYVYDSISLMPFSWIIEPKAKVVRELSYDTYFTNIDGSALILNSKAESLQPKLIKGIDPKTVYNLDLERLIIRGSNNLLGLANYNGDTIIRPIYNDIKIIINGEIYACNFKGKWGLINKNGINLSSVQYKLITSSFINGRQYIKAVNFEDKTGLYNEKGELIYHAFYNDIEPSDLEGFYIINKNGGMGIIDSRNNIYVTPEFDEVRVFKDTLFIAKRNNQYQVFSNRTSPLYKGLSPIIDIYKSSLVSIEDNKIIKIGIKNKALQRQIELIRENDYSIFSLGFDSLILANKEGKWLYLDRLNYLPINNKTFDYLSPMINGYAFAINNNRLFVIDMNFNEVFFILERDNKLDLENQARSIYNSYKNGRDHHIIKDNDKFGIIRLKIIK